MKQVFKIIGSLLIGASLGFAVATLFIIFTTDLTLKEFLGKFSNVELLEMCGVVLFSIIGFLVTLVLHITAHEGGHLAAGLLTGYKFVSFRIFSITFIKSARGIVIKRFKIGGTGGQCLLSPPQRPVEKINTTWYNAGGFLANLLLSGVGLYLFFLLDAALAKTFMFIFSGTGIFFAILNGLPLKVGGIPNDGYNLKMLHKNLESKRAMCTQLKINAAIQEGMRPKFMPAEWFNTPDEESFDWSNPLQSSIRLMEASYIMDCGDIEKSHNILIEAYKNKEKMAPLFVNELVCELIYTSLVTGDIVKAKELYTKDIEKYIQLHSKVMSSKERILFTIELLMNNNNSAAISILNSIKNRKEDYLMQGEVEMDIALMERLLQ